MGARGKLPSDTALLKLRGTSAGKRKAETGPPEFGPMDATPPDRLDGVALQTWREIVPPLIADGTLQSVHRNVVEAYCRTHADCVRLRAILRDEGEIIKGRGGVPKQHPANGMLRRAENMALLLARELGASPASRGRVQRTPPSDEQPNAMAKLVKCVVPVSGTDDGRNGER